jgi:deoxyribonuclease-4
VKDTGCFLCIDFAHLEARQGKQEFAKDFAMIKKARLKKLHCHFSGIEYKDKGEIRHLITPEKKWIELLKFFKEFKISASIINESPDPYFDTLKGLKAWKSLNK